MSSLKTGAGNSSFPAAWVPEMPQWSNYERGLILPRIPVIDRVMNSTLIVVLVTFGSLITASLTAYSMARFEYRGRNLFFMITLATLMMPAQVTLIPQFVLFYKIGWINTLCRCGYRSGLAAAVLRFF